VNVFRPISRVVLNVVDQLGGEWVLYRRGRKELRIKAVRGATAETVEGDGVKLLVRRMDWLINRAVLDFGQGPAMPEAGDEVVEQDGTRWELTSPGGNARAWRWSDRERTRYRCFVWEIKADG